MPFKFWSSWLGKKKPLLPPPPAPDDPRPPLLVITSEKQDQPLYRDLEIGRRFATLRISDSFPFAEFDYDWRRILAHYYGPGRPDWVWLNYTHRYTPRLTGWEALEVPIVAWVGDPQDFLIDSPVHREKVAFFRQVRPDLLVSPQTQADAWVRQGLEDDATPILDCLWGVPAEIFRPLGRRRRYDIACLGSHTAAVYPFRNQVRHYLLAQHRLKFFRKMRVGGKDGVLFARTLNRLRGCFTDASVYGFTLAKYFEIPACGTLLFGQSTVHLEALGYRDGENFVEVTPENFAEKMAYYLLEVPAEEIDRITRAGVELVHQRHTWKHRIDRLMAEVSQHLGRKWPEYVYHPD